MPHPTLLPCLLAGLLLLPSAKADEAAHARAFANYAAGQHAQALAQFRQLAEGGDALAQYNYAMMLKRGEAGSDTSAWLPWLEKAARGGVRNAAYALGLVHEHGEGVPRSQPLASQWFQRAAELGHTQAQLSLGTQYFLGRGVAKDFRLAVIWYEKAAEGGDMAAQYLVAAMYEHGDGTAPDRAKALLWYTAAARQGDPVAKLKAEALAKQAD